jgi:hypothetical protein
LIKVEKK